MSQSKFIQIHTLTSYPASLLNRDDAGFAKRMPFGGTTRTRISSQCLKYHWRNFDGENALYAIDISKKSYRSREIFKRKVVIPLINEGHNKQLVQTIAATLQVLLLHDKSHLDSNGKLKKSSIDEFWSEVKLDFLNTGQLTIFGQPEINHIKEVITDEIKHLEAEIGEKNKRQDFSDDDISIIHKELNEYFKSRGSKTEQIDNLKGLKQASGLDAAMFGRMVTSDILARGDAALHVAHALTTHAEESESDYFSVVDELRRDEPEESGEMGAAHINSTELTSGLFYNYVVIDIPLLVSNLEGIERKEWSEADHTLASEVINRMIHLIATVSPGAKLGSTAPYSYADFLMVETGTSQPRTLANAFRNAVSMNGSGVLANSYRALANHVNALDSMYGKRTDRRIAAIEIENDVAQKFGVDHTVSVDDIAQWAVSQVGA